MNGTKNLLAAVPHLDLLTLLQVVFKDGDTIPEGDGPEYTREPGDTARGTMLSSLARRIFAAQHELSQMGIALHHAHDLYHEAWGAKQHGGPVCKAHDAQMKRIVSRVDVLRLLMWFEARSHHPQLGSNHVTLCNGWKICSKAGSPPWNRLTPEVNPGDVVHGFMERLRSIVGAANIEAIGVPLKPIAAEEKALTTVTDKRLRSLWVFATRIDEALTTYRAGGKTGEKFDLTVAHYRNTAELARRLFWCALQDTDPAVADLDAELLKLRDGWKVVQVGPSIEELRELVQQVAESLFGSGMFAPDAFPPGAGEPTDRTSERPGDKRMRVRIIRVGGAPDAGGQNGQDGLFAQLQRQFAGK